VRSGPRRPHSARTAPALHPPIGSPPTEQVSKSQRKHMEASLQTHPQPDRFDERITVLNYLSVSS